MRGTMGCEPQGAPGGCGCPYMSILARPRLKRRRKEIGLFLVERRILAGRSRLRSFSPPDSAPIRRHPQQPSVLEGMLVGVRTGR